MGFAHSALRLQWPLAAVLPAETRLDGQNAWQDKFQSMGVAGVLLDERRMFAA
jgi:hypothetical protein